VGPVGPRRPARRVSASPGVGSSLWAVDPPFGPRDRHSLRQVKLWDIWSLDDTHTHIYIYIYVHIYTHIYITKYNGGYVPRFIFMDMFRSLDTWRYELEQ
jgi:hypothetical protein